MRTNAYRHRENSWKCSLRPARREREFSKNSPPSKARLAPDAPSQKPNAWAAEYTFPYGLIPCEERDAKSGSEEAALGDSASQTP
jgi:hypothetical protein